MVNKGLDLELTTMQAIAVAFDGLEPSTRTRVMRWLQERYLAEAAPVFPAIPVLATVTQLRAVPPRPIAQDEFLAVGALTELFKPRQPEIVAAPAEQPVTTMLHEFVTEFQDLAREWDGATQALPAAS